VKSLLTGEILEPKKTLIRVTRLQENWINRRYPVVAGGFEDVTSNIYSDDSGNSSNSVGHPSSGESLEIQATLEKRNKWMRTTSSHQHISRTYQN